MRLVTLTMDVAVQVRDSAGHENSGVRLEDVAAAVEEEIQMFAPTVVVRGERVGEITRVACVRKSEQ